MHVIFSFVYSEILEVTLQIVFKVIRTISMEFLICFMNMCTVHLKVF
jgi:hypothetical protein